MYNYNSSENFANKAKSTGSFCKKNLPDCLIPIVYENQKIKAIGKGLEKYDPCLFSKWLEDIENPDTFQTFS